MKVIKEYTNAGTGYRYVIVQKPNGKEVTYGYKVYQELKKKERDKNE